MSRLTVLLCALALAATACAQGLTSPGLVAEINGDRISLSDLESQVDVYLGATNPQTGEGPTREQATDQALFQTTLATLLDQVIDRRGGDPVTESDIDALLEQTIEDAGGQQAFEAGLASQGLTPEAFRLGQQVGLRVERLQGLLAEDIQVSDEEIQAAYDAQYGEPTVAHILVATEEEAQAALDRLESGESFAEVAMDVSTDPGSGPNGGDLGPLQIGAFVPEFEEAALALQSGEVSDPVQTQFGFHIITVNDPPALSEVRDQIQEALQAQQSAQWSRPSLTPT
jgi:parvulin-like peptidyl-prolyl isomerase